MYRTFVSDPTETTEITFISQYSAIFTVVAGHLLEFYTHFCIVQDYF